MAIKFAAKDPAKGEPVKPVKDVAPPKVTVAKSGDEKSGDEAVDLFESDPKPAGRKSKSK